MAKSKKNIKKRQQKAKERTIKRLEKEDILGIDRKLKHQKYLECSPKVFLILKISLVIAIPIIYFLHSKFLILLMVCDLLLFIVARGAERKLNKSYLKQNHIKIPKFSAIISTVVIALALFGSLMQTTHKPKGNSESNVWMEIQMKMTSISTCLTGNRSLLFDNHKHGFGMSGKPDGFKADGGDVTGQRPPDGKEFSMDISDLPLEMLFSMITSSAESILIFMVSGVGAVDILIFIKRRKRYDDVINQSIIDTSFTIDKEMLQKILMWDVDIIE